MQHHQLFDDIKRGINLASVVLDVFGAGLERPIDAAVQFQ
jgi:hypothetical protein